MATRRQVFFVSDGTGITAETLGASLLTQFDGVDFDVTTLAYIDTIAQAEAAAKRINQAAEQAGMPPIIFCTLIDKAVKQPLLSCQAVIIDYFDTFIEPLERALDAQSSYRVGQSHAVKSFKRYQTRIDAINFTLTTDDGNNTHRYQHAEVILVGVSRCGKTPTSLYLALQYGINVANYPFVEEELRSCELPRSLKQHRDKLFGLSIDAQRLCQIRCKRLPNSHYATLTQCQQEIRAIENLYRYHQIPFLNSTDLSIEEIATRVMAATGVQRQLV